MNKTFKSVLIAHLILGLGSTFAFAAIPAIAQGVSTSFHPAQNSATHTIDVNCKNAGGKAINKYMSSSYFSDGKWYVTVVATCTFS